jgi:hypothetical protein
MRINNRYIHLVSVLFIMGFLYAQDNSLQSGRKHWILFRDKGQSKTNKSLLKEEAAALGISRRALVRRGKVSSGENLIDMADIPVSPEYIQRIIDMGLVPQAISRWLNGISAEIPPSIMGEVKSLLFVRDIRPVASFERKPMPSTSALPRPSTNKYSAHTFDYGLSYTQNSLVHVPEVHDLGFSGQGVLVGVIDTGFDYAERPVFEHLDVVAERDFHWRDDTTSNQDNDPGGQHSHGTQVLSVLGGFREGRLIGPAYGATFALAKSEWVSVSDLKVEEDHWIMAIEWLEAVGADVVSSSLGYATFVDGEDYTEDQLDGNTALITRAADLAAGKGVVVVNSAGNKDFWTKVNFPADGDSVIAVGAVSSNGILAQFSSEGPTVDGRIKPDIVAMGTEVVSVALSDKEENYSTGNGTSFSCPMAAGVCALILEARPELGPMDVRDALRETADRAGFPDNQYGWGLINAYEAIFYHGMIFTNFRRIPSGAGQLEGFEVDVLSKTGIIPDSVFVFFRHAESTDYHRGQMAYLDVEDSHRLRFYFPQLLNMDDLLFYITASDTQYTDHTGPFGAPDVLYSFTDDIVELVTADEDSGNGDENEIPNRFELHQNYPNPFNTETRITFDITETSQVTLKIYNMLGQEVITLIDTELQPGNKEVIWYGRDYDGRKAASGIYLYRLQADDRSGVRKMILVN